LQPSSSRSRPFCGGRVTESGRPLPSQARCTLVENPPLERPEASPSAFMSPLLRPRSWRARVLRPRHADGPGSQGEPVRSFQRIPLMMVRWSLHWPPLWPYSGKSGSICRQARSVISLRLIMTFSPVVALFCDYEITQTRISRQKCPRELEGFWLAPTAQAVDLCVRPAPHQRSPRWSLARRSYRTSQMCA
jgi:hypothetical protein